MKKYLLIILTWLISVASIAQFKESESKYYPKPTEVAAGHNEEKQKQTREAWIEYMHRCAPGVDWRKINRENSHNQYFRQQAQRGFADSLLNGNLVGHWVEKGSLNNSGRTLVCEYDSMNNRLIVGSGGGNVWIGNLDGTDWHCINDGLNFKGFWMIRAIPVDGGKTRIICVTEGKDVYYTEDNGKNWQTSTGLANVKNWGNITFGVMANDSAQTIAISVHEWDYVKWKGITSIYSSTNHVDSFSRDTLFYDTDFGGPDQFALWTPRYGNGKIYLLADSLVLIRSKAGLYSTIGTVARQNRGRTLLAGIDKNSKTTLYAYYDKSIYKSTNTGANWTLQSSGNKSPYHKTFYCGLDNEHEVYLGEVEYWTSRDDGKSFNKFCNWYDYYPNITGKLHADIQSISAVRNKLGNEILYIQTDGGTYISDDALKSVYNLSLEGLNVSQYYSVFTNKTEPKYIYAGSQDQGFQAGEDSAKLLQLTQVISGDYGHIVSADSGETSIWMNYPGFAAIYPQIKTSFQNKSEGFDKMGTGMKDQLWIPPLIPEPNNPNTCWLGGGSSAGGESHLYKLTYASGNQTVFSQEDTFDFSDGKSDRISAMAISPLDPSNRYVMTDKGIFWISTDGGNYWTKSQGFTGPGANYLYGAAILPSTVDAKIVYVGGSGYSVAGFWKSEDGGLTFTKQVNGLPKTMIYELAINETGTIVFAATDAGPYVFDVVSSIWEYMGGNSAPDQNYWSVDYIPRTKTVRFATYGRGIWDFVPGIGIGLELKNIPKTSTLIVYPNPAKNSLNIELKQAKHTEVKWMGVYSIEGKLMLQSEWTNQLDISMLTPGNYFLRLHGKELMLTQKITIVK